jgi:hypothetical protein
MEGPATCFFCEKELLKTRGTKLRTCIYCGAEYYPAYSCPDGHYICDSCRAKTVTDLIFDYCLVNKSRNPFETAVTLMKFPGFKMHCPEHHFLVPAVLLSAYCKVRRRRSKLKGWLKAARNRADKVPGAFCGTHGSCGTAVGTGIFVSIITGATPLKAIEWELTNTMTGRSLLRMAPYGGPRCCKRVTFLSLQEAGVFLSQRMGVAIDVPGEIHCEFSQRNEQCLKEDCPFYTDI